MKNLIYILSVFLLTSFSDNSNIGINVKWEITQQKSIYKYISNSTDLEDQYRILKTSDEITYHTFDFNKNIITMETQTSEGEWEKHNFKIKNASVKESLSGLRGLEFEIDNPHCFQIWVDTVGSIGYELKNGQKLVFYGVREIK